MPGGVEEGVVLPGVQTGGQQAAAVRIPPAARSRERSAQTKLGSNPLDLSFLRGSGSNDREGSHAYT